MKNDLTHFERNLLRSINIKEGTKYNYRHLMEWSNDKKMISDGLKTGERKYTVGNYAVAILLNP